MDAASYTVRTAETADLLVLARLVKGVPDLADAELSRIEIDTWLEMMAMPHLRVYLAELAGEAVGFAASVRMPHLTYDCRPTLFVESMQVLEAHRRRGMATLILRRPLDDARHAGCHKVQLLTHKRHATDGAHDLYRSLGFVAEAEGFRLYLT